METILQHLPPPYDLVVKLLSGGGLRLSECLQLHVPGFTVDAGVFTRQDGKVGKDRTAPLPDTFLPALRAPLDSWQDLHQRDRERDSAGVCLVNALENKYQHAAKALIWPWCFPAKQLTSLQKTTEYRQYHVRATPLHKAIQEAVGKARIDQRASAQTCRHSVASHLLQAHDDIRTIQE
jgi:site-specific recombinase XerD